MKSLSIITFLLVFAAPAAAEPLGTGFSYQGELKLAGQPANGNFDFQFKLYDVASGGVPVMVPIELEDVHVADGVFTVELDFGSEVFDGTQLWLEVGAREGELTGNFTTLSPRQKLTAIPHALHSLTVQQGSSVAQRAFVGYSSGTLESGIIRSIWWESAELCRADFGANATMATNREIRAAIDDGTFVFPSTKLGIAVYRLIDLQSFASDGSAYDPHLSHTIPNANQLGLVNASVPLFGWSENPVGLPVACSQ